MSRSAPDLVVIAGPPLESDRLRYRNLHMVDIAAGHDRSKQGVGEAQHEQVLNGLLAEIVIDPVGAALGDQCRHGIIDGAGGGEIAADRLFQDQRASFEQALCGEVLADRHEQSGAVDR